MSTDIYKISRKSLLKEFRRKRNEQSRNFSSLKNVGSTYYDSCKAFLDLTNRIVMLIEESPESVDDYRTLTEPVDIDEDAAWLDGQILAHEQRISG